MEFERKTLPEQHYLYVDREIDDFSKVAEAMATGFGEVFGFASASGITPTSMPVSLYLEMPSGPGMKFRCGAFVSAEDAAKASGNVKADTIPAGEAVAATHVGPYANMNQSHSALWAFCDSEGLTKTWPVWEEYVDDPTDTEEAVLRTAIARRVV